MGVELSPQRERAQQAVLLIRSILFLAVPLPMSNLGWVDYVTLLVALVIPSLVSLYFGVVSKTKIPTDEKQHMGLFPVIMSLTASTVSGVAMLAAPSDAYLNGIFFSGYKSVTHVLTAAVSTFFFIPVLYNLKMESVYEYFELRFDSRLRKLATFIHVISQISYAAIAVCPPAAVIRASIDASAHGLLTFCTLCALIGGFKGVVWTDTFQTIIMWVFLVALVILATVKGGGLMRIFTLSQESGRFEIFEMNLDPTVRMSFWSGTIGLLFMSITVSILNPPAFQRYVVLKSERTAMRAAFLNALQIGAMYSLLCYCGLGIFASFYGCDPKSAGAIHNYLSITTYFVDLASKKLDGLKGLFIAGIVSGSLSTMSTNINTAATLLYTEFVRKWFRAHRVNGQTAVRILSGLVGLSSMAFLALFSGADSILDIYQLFMGGIGGLCVGLFILGMFCLGANSKGAFWGGAAAFCLMATMLIGSSLYESNKVAVSHKTLSSEMCALNATVTSLTKSHPIAQPSQIPWLFRISSYYYSFIAAGSTVIFGVIFSWLSTALERPEPERRSQLKKELFCPLIVSTFKKRFYLEVPAEAP